jgi:hypothetical protein
MIQPTGAATKDGRGDEEEGDNAKTPLTQLMGWGNRVQLLQLLDLEDKWECTRKEEHSDGEWECCHGCRALSLGACPCKEKMEEGGGMDGGGPGDNDCNDDQRDDRALSSPLSRGGRTLCPPSQDLMRSNIKRNFWMPLLLGDVIVLCRLLWWGVESKYTSVPYNVVIGANFVASPYNPVALAQTFHALVGHGQGFTSRGAFEGEMARLFMRVRRVDGPHSWLMSLGIFIRCHMDGKMAAQS